MSITKLSSVSRVSPVSCSNAPFLTPPQNLFCTTFPSLNFLSRTSFLVQLSRDLNYPIPGCMMPHGPVQGSVTSTHASCYKRSGDLEKQTYWPCTFPPTSPLTLILLPAIERTTSGLEGRRPCATVYQQHLNSVPHIVRMPTPHALVTARAPGPVW